MFGRGTLFIAVIGMAIAIPYFLTNDTEIGSRFAGLRDSMIQNEAGSRQPIPSASPLPIDRVTSRTGLSTRTQARGATAPLTADRIRGLPRGANTSGDRRTLPPGATATPWMPIDGSWPTAEGSGPTTRSETPSHIGPELRHFSDLFRFNITPDWVLQNWPRVSTQLAELSFTRLRVPVVTGKDIHDLAGSLSYYFDGQQQLQRITFDGTTGDAAQLVRLGRSRFGMQQAVTLDGTSYISVADNAVTNMLRVQHMPVVKRSRPHQRYRVALELNRPGKGRYLSDANATVLERQRRLIEMQRARTVSPIDAKADNKFGS